MKTAYSTNIVCAKMQYSNDLRCNLTADVTDSLKLHFACSEAQCGIVFPGIVM